MKCRTLPAMSHRGWGRHRAVETVIAATANFTAAALAEWATRKSVLMPHRCKSRDEWVGRKIAEREVKPYPEIKKLDHGNFGSSI